jgi:hypothetical protein
MKPAFPHLDKQSFSSFNLLNETLAVASLQGFAYCLMMSGYYYQNIPPHYLFFGVMCVMECK